MRSEWDVFSPEIPVMTMRSGSAAGKASPCTMKVDSSPGEESRTTEYHTEVFIMYNEGLERRKNGGGGSNDSECE